MSVSNCLRSALSSNKFLCKDRQANSNKPARLRRSIAPERGPRRCSAIAPSAFLHGVGPKFAEKACPRRPSYTVKDIQGCRSEGPEIRPLMARPACGLKANAPTALDTPPGAPMTKSASPSPADHVSAVDLSDPAGLKTSPCQLCVKTADRAKARRRPVGVVVTLKLKDQQFPRPEPGGVSLGEPDPACPRKIFRAGRPLLAASEVPMAAKRLPP